MKEILDDVRRDTITKLKTSKDGGKVLAEAAELMIDLSETVRLKGLLHLKEEVGPIGSDLLGLAASAALDTWDPAFVAEIISNAYWIDEPEGVQAMVGYIYLRGMLCILQGDTPLAMWDIFESLMPMELRSGFSHEMIFKLDSKKSEEICRQICPSFKDADTLENIRILEKKVSALNKRSLQKILKDMDFSDLALCVYAMDPEIRKKIIDNISISNAYFVMERVVQCHQIQFDRFDEKEVSRSVCAMAKHVERLEKNGEIILG